MSDIQEKVKTLRGFTNAEKSLIADKTAGYLRRVERMRDAEMALNSAFQMLDHARRNENKIEEAALELVIDELEAKGMMASEREITPIKPNDAPGQSSGGLFSSHAAGKTTFSGGNRVKEAAPENALSLGRIRQDYGGPLALLFEPLLQANRPSEELCGKWIERSLTVGQQTIPVKIGYFSANQNIKTNSTWYVDGTDFLAVRQAAKTLPAAKESSQENGSAKTDVAVCKETLKRIIHQVSEVTGVPSGMILKGGGIAKDVSRARHITSYMIYTTTGLSMDQIAQYMHLSQATVPAMIRAEKKLLKQEAGEQALINDIAKELGMTFNERTQDTVPRGRG